MPFEGEIFILLEIPPPAASKDALEYIAHISLLRLAYISVTFILMAFIPMRTFPLAPKESLPNLREEPNASSM